jgi:hypothetical protein
MFDDFSVKLTASIFRREATSYTMKAQTLLSLFCPKERGQSVAFFYPDNGCGTFCLLLSRRRQ